MENVQNVLSHIMSQMKSLSLKDIVALIQICFYIIGATIAILTYRSAKRGLLNTVNTEYHKKVIEHLESLSETLYSEFDIHSDFYYDFSFNLSTRVKDAFESHNRKIKEGRMPEHFGGISFIGPTELEVGLYRLREQIKSSPFLPDHITNYVVEYITNRLDVISFTKLEHFRKEIKPIMLKRKLFNPDEEFSYVEFGLKVNADLKEKGYSMKDAELEVHKIRTMIKDYLKSFNPLP